MDITKNFQKWYKDFTCGYCHKKLGFDIRYAEAEFFEEQLDVANGQGFAVAKCRDCGYLNIVILNVKGDIHPGGFDYEYELNIYLDENPDILTSDWIEYGGPTSFAFMVYQGQYPFGLQISNDVPSQIQNDIREAFNCLSVNAPNASVMMSRRVIQQISLSFGVKEDMFLGTALNGLKEKGLISDELHEALMEVKNWGDGGAHPRKVTPIYIEEARKVAELMFILVKTIFPVKDDSKSLVDKLKEIRKGKSR